MSAPIRSQSGAGAASSASSSFSVARTSSQPACVAAGSAGSAPSDRRSGMSDFASLSVNRLLLVPV